MRSSPNGSLRASTALLLLFGLLVLAATRAGAQERDSTHWSVFAGQTTSSASGADRTFGFPSENFGIGGSVEFRSRLLPVPLRATVAYDKFRSGPFTTFKVTSLKVDAMFRPLPSVMGIRPYLLGGFGIATQAPSGTQDVDNGTPRFVPVARHTALELDAGVGLEFRRFFVEYRRSPFSVWGQGMPARGALRLGMRL